MTSYFRLYCVFLSCTVQMWHGNNSSEWATHYGVCVCGWHCTLIFINTLQNQQLSWDGGDWKCNTDNWCPLGSLSADYSYCISQDRQLMQIQKLVLGAKFGAHIVEQSNYQALKTVFMSSRRSCSRQKTSCMVLIGKVKHFSFYFCCIICEFLLFY